MKSILIISASLLPLSVIALRLFNNVLPSNKKLSRLDSSFNKNIHQGFVEVYSIDGNLLHRCEKNMNKDDFFILASITKLYTHALIYILIDEGKINIEDKISQILPKVFWENVNVRNNQDLSDQITIKHLLDQNSGIADYETDKIQGKESIMDKLIEEDFSLNPLDAIKMTRNHEGVSEPGSSKSYYSNLNAILLGLIIEQKTRLPLIDAMEKYIFSPLNLKETKLISKNLNVIPFYLNEKKVERIKYLKSALAPGGLVATSQDVFKFLEAFFTGKLFDMKHIKNPTFRELQFFPLKYGSGMMKMKLSFIMSPLFESPEIRGHSGSTGSFAFYCPKKKVYIIGTTNQVKNNPYQTIYTYLDAF